jgi:hypothetical protein
MAKRNRRARNTIAGSVQGQLVTTGPPVDPTVPAHQTSALRVARPTLFSAEFEKVIEIIARERVYREMLARLGSRLLMAPRPNDDPRIEAGGVGGL